MSHFLNIFVSACSIVRSAAMPRSRRYCKTEGQCAYGFYKLLDDEVEYVYYANVRAHGRFNTKRKCPVAKASKLRRIVAEGRASSNLRACVSTDQVRHVLRKLQFRTKVAKAIEQRAVKKLQDEAARAKPRVDCTAETRKKSRKQKKDKMNKKGGETVENKNQDIAKANAITLCSEKNAEPKEMRTMIKSQVKNEREQDAGDGMMQIKLPQAIQRCAIRPNATLFAFPSPKRFKQTSIESCLPANQMTSPSVAKVKREIASPWAPKKRRRSIQCARAVNGDAA